jgi:hypothetical protein
VLQEPGAPDVLNKAADILQWCCTPFTEGVLHMDIGILHTAMEPILYVLHAEANIIKTPISEVLWHTWEKGRTELYGNDHIITKYKWLNIAGLQYCNHSYSWVDSCVFFENTAAQIVLGVIEYIFSVEKDHTWIYYIMIWCYLPVAVGYQDPILGYSDFGAQI